MQPTNPARPKIGVVGYIMAYENGELDEEDVINFFQHIITSGLVWQLQGSYGHTASRLIEAGYCTA